VGNDIVEQELVVFAVKHQHRLVQESRVITRIRLTLILAVLSCALSGCAVKVAVISTYVLTPPTLLPVSATVSQNHAVLLISAMTADPGYKTKAMIYAKTPAHLRPFAKAGTTQTPLTSSSP
jgi:hypothetical protein